MSPSAGKQQILEFTTKFSSGRPFDSISLVCDSVEHYLHSDWIIVCTAALVKRQTEPVCGEA